MIHIIHIHVRVFDVTFRLLHLASFLLTFASLFSYIYPARVLGSRLSRFRARGDKVAEGGQGDGRTIDLLAMVAIIHIHMWLSTLSPLPSLYPPRQVVKGPSMPSPEDMMLLTREGWTVRLVDAWENPFGHDEKARGVFSKLAIFSMQQYQRLVYMDLDVSQRMKTFLVLL